MACRRSKVLHKDGKEITKLLVYLHCKRKTPVTSPYTRKTSECTGRLPEFQECTVYGEVTGISRVYGKKNLPSGCLFHDSHLANHEKCTGRLLEDTIPGAPLTSPYTRVYGEVTASEPLFEVRDLEELHSYYTLPPRVRKDIQTAVAFLTTRVKKPDEDNWG
eukprot:CCRYP_010985-RA/>CCRYP_010985-RA protein AED:0.82 eAED:0.47 QI:0/0/0/0.66/0/0/3/0/161